MRSIRETCEPRPDLLRGSFSTDVFTASLRQVVGHYRCENRVDTPYTDANAFFREATAPTHGMRRVIEHVMRRLQGDMMVPFLSRLETGFGGGKTHTLIACTHLAHRGRNLAEVAGSIGLVDPAHLPEPGSVNVVGIAGDVVDVVRTQGEQVVPFTIWAELARQIGGDDLLEAVKAEAQTVGAPGEAFFDTVLGGRTALIMIDELAQYAARAEAAHPGAGQQIAAFFMGLFNYARNHTGISIVVTLASSTDAFGSQTKELQALLGQVSGRQLSQDDAREIGEKAIDGVESVMKRDAQVEKPVSGEELSAVLAKRLFTRVDTAAAKEAAAEYKAFYEKHGDQLPPRCTRSSGDEGGSGYEGLIEKYYPLHPTLVEFLNKKLATAEDFQGTRGVLRVLAFAVRSIWHRDAQPPAIHTCHLDTSDADLVNEVLNRTEAGDLYNVLTADVGAVRTDPNLSFSKSNAEICDDENPHPAGLPLHVYSWRTVFLHSLVGREQGVASPLFGLVEAEARLEVAQPGIPPSQVDTALAELAKRAFYLRHQDGKFYASLEPSVNKALSQIRGGVTDGEVESVLQEASRKVVTAPVPTFEVLHDVATSEHFPDRRGKPMLGIVSLLAGEIQPDAMVLQERNGQPREQQNLVFVLVPNTVKASVKEGGQAGLFVDDELKRNLSELKAVARDVVAMRRLERSPADFAIDRRHIADDSEEGFRTRKAEREQALLTRTTEAYTSLWYPSASGQVMRKEVQTSGGEGGESVIEQVRKLLTDDQELICENMISATLLQQFKPIFFSGDEATCRLEQIRKNFLNRRTWPVLSEAKLLNQLVRQGVDHGEWCLYRLADATSTRPEEFYVREGGGVPMQVDLDQGDYRLVTPEGALQRGWNANTDVPPETLVSWVRAELETLDEALTVAELGERVAAKHGDVSTLDVGVAVVELTRSRVAAVQPPGSDTKYGDSALMYAPAPEDKVLPASRAVEKGWIEAPRRLINLTGQEARDAVLPLLRRLASLYSRGAKSKIDQLRVDRLPLKAGGTVSVTFSSLEPEQIKQLGGLLDSLSTQGEPSDDTDVALTVMEPLDGCSLVDELGGAD